jgi:DNA-directed RNA polymerase specialized sigma24 family protein
MTSRAMSENPSAASFPTTRWSRVAAAGDRATPEDLEALAELCRAYWYPLYAFIRRQGYAPADAQDLTQSYFARLLERGVLAAADPRKGRFRAFLRTDCGFFLADQHDRDRALKRGGGIAPVSIDARDAEGRYRVEPADATTPDRLFDRDWALTLLDRVLDLLERDCADSGRSAFFERAKIVLTDGPRAVAHATIADELGMTVAAVEAAIRRLRERYRCLLCEEIAATLDDSSPEAIDDEIRALFDALGP